MSISRKTWKFMGSYNRSCRKDGLGLRVQGLGFRV